MEQLMMPRSADAMHHALQSVLLVIPGGGTVRPPHSEQKLYYLRRIRAVLDSHIYWWKSELNMLVVLH